MNKVHYSSAKSDWATPLDLYNILNEEFNFTIDVCANKNNNKCPDYYDEKLNGLKQVWSGRFWMNPPYGEPESVCKKSCKKKKCIERGFHNSHYIPGIIDWMRKAWLSSVDKAELGVCLIPSRTDTKWWHSYAMKAAEIRLIKGRVKFEGAPFAAPFPSTVAIFRKDFKGKFPVFTSMSCK